MVPSLTRTDPPSPPSPPSLPSLSLLADATPHFHVRPSNATIPIVRVGDYAKVGLLSERLWVRIAHQRRPRLGTNVLYECIVDSDLQRTPPSVVKLGDRLTLSNSCILESKTVAEGEAFRAYAMHHGNHASNLLAMAVFAGRPRVAWPAPYGGIVAGILPDGTRVIE
jgi:hypothetical protein